MSKRRWSLALLAAAVGGLLLSSPAKAEAGFDVPLNYIDIPSGKDPRQLYIAARECDAFTISGMSPTEFLDANRLGQFSTESRHEYVQKSYRRFTPGQYLFPVDPAQLDNCTAWTSSTAAPAVGARTTVVLREDPRVADLMRQNAAQAETIAHLEQELQDARNVTAPAAPVVTEDKGVLLQRIQIAEANEVAARVEASDAKTHAETLERELGAIRAQLASLEKELDGLKVNSQELYVTNNKQAYTIEALRGENQRLQTTLDREVRRVKPHLNLLFNEWYGASSWADFLQVCLMGIAALILIFLLAQIFLRGVRSTPEEKAEAAMFKAERKAAREKREAEPYTAQPAAPTHEWRPERGFGALGDRPLTRPTAPSPI